MRAAFFTLVALASGAGLARSKPVDPIWLACGSPKLIAAAGELADLRRAQGFDVVLATVSPAEAIASCPRPPVYLVLLGDEAPKGLAPVHWNLPAPRGSQYRWRAEQAEDFPADPLWGDLDGDRVPDIPVGRIPARSTEDLRTVIRKIIDYEGRSYSANDLGLPIWGGTPAYGKLLDEGATTMLLSTVRKHTPAWSEPWMIFGNPRSPLSAHPPDQPAIFNARLGQGGYVTTLMGHGAPDLFYSQRHGDREISYRVQDAMRLGSGPPSSPMIIFACDCGQFAGDRHSLAEALLFAPGGPVACVAATTESHPLTNYYSSLGLLSELPEENVYLTFGELWHRAQMRGFKTKKRLTEALLKNAEGALEAEINIPKLKSDQLLMYALLGDPATRLPRITPIDIELSNLGDRTSWKVDAPLGWELLEVGFRRPGDAPRTKPETATREAAMKLFEQRNAAWDFTRQEHAAAWTGSVTGSGTLRVVGRSRDRLLVGMAEIAPKAR